MIPPRDVSFKVGHQSIGRREDVSFLRCFGVPVIALAAFVVVPQDTSLFDHVGEAIPEPMRRRRDRRRDTPDHHFDERVGSEDYPAANQGHSLHVGENTNTQLVLSTTPTISA
jgi:hypothetical protein